MKADVLVEIEDDGDAQNIVLRVVETQVMQRFFVGAQSDSTLGAFVREYVMGVGIKKMKGEKVEPAPEKEKPKPQAEVHRLRSDGSWAGHLARIVLAIQNDDQKLLFHTPADEIEKAQAHIETIWHVERFW